jgi:hypothetical protein
MEKEQTKRQIDHDGNEDYKYNTDHSQILTGTYKQEYIRALLGRRGMSRSPAPLKETTATGNDGNW